MPWEYACVLSKGSVFVHDLFLRYLHVHKRKKEWSKSYKPADGVTSNVAYVLEPCRCMTTIVLMDLTKWLHPVDLGHLSGATDETCRRERSPFDILRIILGHANQASQDVHYRDIYVTYSGWSPSDVCRINPPCPKSLHVQIKIQWPRSSRCFTVHDISLRSEISRQRCTFKLSSLTCFYPFDEYLGNF